MTGFEVSEIDKYMMTRHMLNFAVECGFWENFLRCSKYPSEAKAVVLSVLKEYGLDPDKDPQLTLQGDAR